MQKMLNMQKVQKMQGLSLIEVLIAMLLVAIGLLGLAAAQIKTLQFASSSLHQTVASIQLQNAIERIWPDLCRLQQGSVVFNNAYQTTLSPDTALDPRGYQLVFTAHNFQQSPLTATQPLPLFQLSVEWVDRRLKDQTTHQLDMSAGFPWLRNGNPAGCV